MVSHSKWCDATRKSDEAKGFFFTILKFSKISYWTLNSHYSKQHLTIRQSLEKLKKTWALEDESQARSWTGCPARSLEKQLFPISLLYFWLINSMRLLEISFLSAIDSINASRSEKSTAIPRTIPSIRCYGRRKRGKVGENLCFIKVC